MLKAKHFIAILVPAILVVGFALYVRILQYQPLYPEIEKTTTSANAATTAFVPTFLDDPVIGKKASKTVTIFEDYGCEHCQEQMVLLLTLQRDYSDQFRVVTKGLPVTRFPYNTELAQDYSYCANAQGKYEPFAILAVANGNNLSGDTLNSIAETATLDQTKLATCLASAAPASYRAKVKTLAEKLGITQVPAVYLNQNRIEPPATIEGWKEILGL